MNYIYNYLFILYIYSYIVTNRNEGFESKLLFVVGFGKFIHYHVL